MLYALDVKTSYSMLSSLIKIDDLIKVVQHEFVHTCHEQFKNYKDTLTWINEALATILSNQ